MTARQTGAATVTVEPMRWWHVAQVAALEADLFPHDRWSAEQFWGELAQPTRRYVVALSDGQVVGYAGLFVLAPDADVQTIAVRADQQGSGVGRRLLAELLRMATIEGATQVLLEVRADNARALDLYARAGFTRISQRRGYYPDGGDADILRWESTAEGSAP